MLLSSFCFFLTYLTIKLFIKEVPFFLFTFLRFVFPALLITFILIFQGERKFQVRNLQPHLIRAIFVVIAQFSIFTYIKYTSILNATLMLNTGPLFIPLIERIWKKKKISNQTIIAIMTGFLGVLLILQPRRDIFAIPALLGLCAGFSQAFSQIIYSYQAKKDSVEINLFYLFVLGSLFSGFIFLWALFFTNTATQIMIYASNKQILFFLIALIAIAFFTLGNQFFRGKAYKIDRTASDLAPLLYLSLVFAALADWLVFNHTPTIASIGGSLFIMCSGVINVLAQKNKTK